MMVLLLDIVAAVLWDRLMLLIFAPKILRASMEGTTWRDVLNVFKVVAICTAVIYFLVTVSLLHASPVHVHGYASCNYAAVSSVIYMMVSPDFRSIPFFLLWPRAHDERFDDMMSVC